MSREASGEVAADEEKIQVGMDSPVIKEKIVALGKELRASDDALKASDDADFRAGQLCDEIVELVGIQHGKGTISTIANLPEIQCDPRELRRRWKFYRLVANKDCKTPELDRLIQSKPSAVKELARIMDTDMTEEAKAGLVKALASEADSKDWTTRDMAERVTKELDLRDMLLRKPPKNKRYHRANSEPNGTVVDGEMLKQYAECIRSYGKFCKIESVKDQLAVKSVALAVMDVVEKQAEQLTGDEEYARFLSKLISRLEQMLLLLLGKNGPGEIAPTEADEAGRQMASGSTSQGGTFYNDPEGIPKIEADEAGQQVETGINQGEIAQVSMAGGEL